MHMGQHGASDSPEEIARWHEKMGIALPHISPYVHVSQELLYSLPSRVSEINARPSTNRDISALKLFDYGSNLVTNMI